MPDYISEFNRMFTVKVDALKEKYKGSDKEQVMSTIFSRLDQLDNVPSFLIDEFLKDSTESSTCAQDKKIMATTNFLINIRDNILENGEISLEKIQKIFGQDVSIEDVKQAFDDVLVESEKEHAKAEAEYEEFQSNMINSIDDESLPEDIKKLVRPGSTVDIIEVDGKKYYSLTDEEAGMTIDYNEKGQRIRISAWFEDDGYYGAGEEIFLLDESENHKAEIYKYDTGLIQKHDLETGKKTLQFGKTVFEFEEKRLLSEEEIDKRRFEDRYNPDDGWKTVYKNLTVNKGLPNETKLDFELDENGNVKDIKLATEEKERSAYLGDGNYASFKMPPIGISQEEKQTLIDMINNGARLGNDFELKINGNKIEVAPTVLDIDGNYSSNVPSWVKNDVIELLNQGFRAGRDYNITQNEDGTFQLDFDSQKAMGYEGDEKIITYSQDGRTKQTTITNADEIKTITNNSNGTSSIKFESRSEQFLMKLLEGDFNSANLLLDDLFVKNNGKFNIYEIGLKYQEKTGKNLMQEAIKLYEQGELDGKMIERLGDKRIGFVEAYGAYDLAILQETYDVRVEYVKRLQEFNPYKSGVSELLPKISEKEQTSDTKYTQTINGDNYTVELSEDNLKITRGEKAVSLSLAGVHPNLQKNIMNANPKALFRLASKNIPFIIKNQFNNVDGRTGGTYHIIDEKIEVYSEVVRGEELNPTLIHEVGHTYYNNKMPKNEALEKCFAEELSVWEQSDELIKSGNEVYCTTNIEEFVAEAYLLLMTGESPSGYTICKYFPKTLALVKELVDNEDRKGY